MHTSQVPRPGRYQRIARVAGGLVAGILVLGAAAYASVPLWFPTHRLAGQIVRDLAAQFGCPVTIGNLQLSWTDGVVIRDLTITGRAIDASSPPLARIGRVSLAFEPLRLMLTRAARELRVDDVAIHLQVGPDGQIRNLPGFPMRGQRGLTFLRCLVSDVRCHLHAPASQQIVRLDRLDFRIDPATGQLRLHAAAVDPQGDDPPGATPSGLFLLEADVTLSRLRHDRQLGGSVRVDWRDLALTDLPLALIPRLPFRQVDGLTSGSVVIHPHPDLSLDYELTMDLEGVELVRQNGNPPGRPINAHLQAGGRWDPAADQLILASLSYRTDALEISDAGEQPVLEVDQGGDTPLQLHLIGRIRDWRLLEHEVPELAELLRTLDAQVAGHAEFALSLRRHRHQNELTLTLDADDTACRVNGPIEPILNAPAGLPKTCRLEVAVDEAHGPRCHTRLETHIDQLSIRLESDATIPPTQDAAPLTWARAAWQQLSLRMAAEIADLEALRRCWPGLAERIGLHEAAGPIGMAVLFEPREAHSELRINVHTSSNTRLALGDWFRARDGEPIELFARINLPHEGTDAELQLRAALGAFRLEVPAAPLRSRFAYADSQLQRPAEPRQVQIDARLDMPMHITGLEALPPFIPRWADLVQTAELSGGLSLQGRVDLTRRPDEFILATRLQLTADPLEVRYGGHLRKPAQQQLRIELDHRFALTGEAREQSGRFELLSRPLRVAADIAFAGLESQDLADDFEQVQIAIEVEDAAAVLERLPELAAAMQTMRIQGRSRLELANLLIGEEQTLRLTAEATDLDVLRDGAGDAFLHKYAGMPARLDLAWRGAPDPDNPSLQRWTLERGQARLGGWRGDQLSGQVLIAAPKQPGEGFVPGVRSAGINRTLHAARQRRFFRSARLKADGLLRFEPSLAYMNDLVRRIFDDYRLSGECGYALELDLSSDRLSIGGTIDGREAGFSMQIENSHFPLVRKPPGAPAEAHFRVDASRGADHSLHVDVREADVALPGVSASLDGAFAVDPAGHPPQLTSFDLTTRLHVLDAQALGRLLPGSDLRLLDGVGVGSVRLSGLDGHILLDTAHLDLSRLLLRTPADPLAIDGVVMAEQDRVTVDQLHVRWGGLDGSLSGDVRLLDGAAAGRVAIAVRQLDLPALLRQAGGPLAGESASDTAATLRQVFDYLRGSRLVITAEADTLRFNLPLAALSVDALTLRTDVHDGQVLLTFRCLAEGGYVTGRCAIDLRDPHAPFHLTYQADRLQPGQLVDRYLALTFPGMKATGPLTLVDETYQKFLPTPGELNHPVGKGEMIIAGGTIEGRAAPDWMVRIFPGLNLASFDFSYMHSWFSKTVDGRIRHQMIYQGRFYNIYAVGTGDAEGRIDYEVGLDFLADFDSRYWAETGQGRIPLFRKTGIKGPDGSLQNEVVTFTPPERILDTLLVRNNPLVTAYHAVRKRVLREQ